MWALSEGRKNAVLFGCNIFLGGNYHAYTLRMLDELGREKVDELLALRHKTLKLSRDYMEGLIEDLQGKLESLEVTA